MSATTIVAASMIGVGVFTTSGFALDALGSPSRVMLAWAIGSVIAMCGAVSYASLAQRFTESGGEYLFLARALHPSAGLTAGFVSLLAGFTGPIAAAALGLEAYAGPLLFAPDHLPPPSTIAISVIVAAAMLNTFRVSMAARVQDVIVLTKLALIVGFLVWSLMKMGSWSTSAPNANQLEPLSLFTLANQLVWISFSFAGFNAAIYISGEIKNPQANVPRAIIAGTLLVSLIYLALNAVFVYAAPMETITSQDKISEVAATAAQAIGGFGLEQLVRIAIAVALATSVTAMMMTGPRVYAKMADDGYMPSWFSFREQPPAIAVWFQAGLAIAVVAISQLKDLLSYLGLTLSLCSALAISTLFLLRARGQISKLPFWGIPPTVFIAASVGFGVLASWGNPIPAYAAVGTLLLGLAIYPFLRVKA
ncbi:amino acid permease [Rubripirellula amarantea]|nr:amino acid permease [Rubripirellula amarantea]